MAGWGNSYRGHNPYDGFDPWEAEQSHRSEQLCYPALDESEGRRMIIVDPYQSIGNYVIKIETTVRGVHPSIFSEFYRQCSPPRYEPRQSYGGSSDKLHRPSMPSNDRPPEVEEFINQIQSEISQPSGFGPPRAPHQLRIPVSARYAEDGDHEKETHKLITNTIKDEDPKADKIVKPPVTTEGYNGSRLGHPPGSVLPSHNISSEREQTIRPPFKIVTGGWERRDPSMALSKPINNKGTAMECLKMDPSSVNTIKDEAPDHGRFKGDKFPKPPVATEGGLAARPGHPTGFVPPNHYLSPDRGERTIQPPSMTRTGGWERGGQDMGLEPMHETGKTMEYSKEAVKPPSVSKVPKKDSTPETIDSKEAKRRYGNVKPSPELYATGNTSTIDSREAARRYKGEFV